MDSIQNLAREKAQELKQRENTIRIIGADPMSKRGFTQVPNFILQNDKLSIGAKLTHAMMLKYAWYDDHCFPGQKTLAKDIGTSDRSVRSSILRNWRKQVSYQSSKEGLEKSICTICIYG